MKKCPAVRKIKKEVFMAENSNIFLLFALAVSLVLVFVFFRYLKMRQKLKEAKEALEEIKTVLEIRVRARTKELEELAQILDAQVKKRTKELKERVDELEKFHRLTVGREIKMIELKRKLKKLESELKRD